MVAVVVVVVAAASGMSWQKWKEPVARHAVHLRCISYWCCVQVDWHDGAGADKLSISAHIIFLFERKNVSRESAQCER